MASFSPIVLESEAYDCAGGELLRLADQRARDTCLRTSRRAHSHHRRIAIRREARGRRVRSSRARMRASDRTTGRPVQSQSQHARLSTKRPYLTEHSQRGSRMRTLDTSDIASYRGPLRGTNSVVECNLAKVEVVGSNPMSRSKMPTKTAVSRPSARWPHTEVTNRSTPTPRRRTVSSIAWFSAWYRARAERARTGCLQVDHG